MTCNLDAIVEFENISSTKIYMADYRFVIATGKGKVILYCKSGTCYERRTLTDVLYVPELGNNLFSVGKVTNLGFHIKFTDQKCFIVKKGKTIAKAYRNGNLNKLDIEAKKLSNFAKDGNDLFTWHKRLGHLNYKSVIALDEMNLVNGIKITNKETKICEACIEGKFKRDSFPKMSETMTKRVLELVHTDICGLMQNTTPAGNRYFLTFIDDFSRFTAIFLMANKDEVFNKFQEYEAHVSNMFGFRMKCLRSDNGSEYKSKRFIDYCKSKGIQRQYSVIYTPQQNGVAERKNRTLVEAARSMLISAKLPLQYWGEAIVTANYLQNRSPT